MVGGETLMRLVLSMKVCVREVGVVVLSACCRLENPAREGVRPIPRSTNYHVHFPTTQTTGRDINIVRSDQRRSYLVLKNPSGIDLMRGSYLIRPVFEPQPSSKVDQRIRGRGKTSIVPN